MMPQAQTHLLAILHELVGVALALRPLSPTEGCGDQKDDQLGKLQGAQGDSCQRLHTQIMVDGLACPID